jgi:hypothetical protein
MFGPMSRRDLLASMGTLAAGAALPTVVQAGKAVVSTPAGPEVQRRAAKKLVLPRAGDFSSSALVGVYDPVPEDQTHRKGYFGLSLDAAWPYGGLETESGKRYLLLRKITYQTTNYLFIQVDGPESVEIDRRCFEKCQFGGTVKRRFANGYDIYDGKLAPMPGMPAFQLKIGHEDFSWVEEGVLSITGKRFAPGWHVYVPWREPTGEAGGCYYTSACWTAEGEIFGEKAKGFFILDHDYLPNGVDWNDESDLIWSKLQQTWGVFATEWDDGTLEWGHFAKGWGDFQFDTVSSNREDLALFSQDVQVNLPFTSDGWIPKIDFTFNQREKWEFVTAPNGRFVQASGLFSALNGVDWRGHSGLMQRVGEKRKAVRHIAWQEVFPQRFGWKA